MARRRLARGTGPSVSDVGLRPDKRGFVGPTFDLRNRLRRLAWQAVWTLLARWTPPPLHVWRVLVAAESRGASIGDVSLSVASWLAGPTGVVVCSMFTSRHIRHNIGAIRVWHGDVSMQAVIDALTADSRSPAVATEAS